MAKQQYGMLFRRGFHATIGNLIATGFEAGVDFRDKPYTDVTMSSSILFGNAPENVAYAEDGSNDCETDTIAADPHAVRAGPGIGREGNIGTLGSR